MSVQTVVFITLVLLIEYNFFIDSVRHYFARLICKLPGHVSTDISEEVELPDDVRSEQTRVLRLHENEQLLKTTSVSAINLAKCFKRGKPPSVNRLSFAVNYGECFGLLGVNGAGKTTTFRMLTGDLRPSEGVAYVNSYHVTDQKRQAHRHLGFCPQFDATFSQLTCRETLILYARIRGVAEVELENSVIAVLDNIGLAPHADKLVGNYSGGNRRKLSTAIAMIGSPAVILLDEPTSGMDPIAKRFFWNKLSQLVRGGKSVILSSHSMGECEALCDRIGIMVNGQFQCFGTVQHLKRSYGSGYTAEVTFSDMNDASDLVQEDMTSNFPGIKSEFINSDYCKFQFPNNLKVSYIFEQLNKALQCGYLKHYSVKQTTLDDVFLNFAQEQK